jgi:DNA-binding NarL/FixJ family response regulator
MAYANRIRILVLHADPFARAGLCATFAKYPDLEVADSDDTTPFSLPTPRQLAAEGIHVVVADYANGVELATRIARHVGACDPCHVLVVASVNREWEIREALARGVRGFVLFGCPLDELAAGVRAVHRGHRHMSPQVAQRLAESLSGEALTSREEEVLRLVVEGLGNKAIAKRLDIAVGTVKSHLKGIFDKLDVQSRTQAICAAERRGLLSPLPQRQMASPSQSEYEHSSRLPMPRYDPALERSNAPAQMAGA